MVTRTRVLFASALLLSAASLTAVLCQSEAGASPPLCDGRPATITGDGYGYRLDGTAGDDVIVTNGASDVYAGDGNDTFTGGGESDTTDDTDGGMDHISTGGGADVMSWNLDGNALPDTGADVVDLGPGNDRMDAADSSVGSTLVGGDGADILIGLDTSAQPAADYVYDAGRGMLSVNGADVEPFSGFEQYSFEFTGRSDTFIGTDAAERVFATGDAPTTIDLEGGNDILGGFLSDFTAHGGTGHDLLQDAYGVRAATTVLNLQTGVLHHTGTAGGPLTVNGRLSGFEDAAVAGPGSVKIVGDAQANRITVTDACTTSITGGPAADVLRVSAPDPGEGIANCTGARIVGGAGDDTMTGSSLADTLFGGAGHDIARGGGGRDKCGAEVKSNCEY